MAKWADYLISEVSYGTNNLITKIKQHHDNGKTISQGEIIDRDTLTNNLGHGAKYMTVYSTLSRFKIGKNVIIDPYVVIGRKVKIGNNVRIHSFCHLEYSKIENNVNLGPYARLRPGAILQKGSRVGNFVEVKKVKLEKNQKLIICLILEILQ